MSKNNKKRSRTGAAAIVLAYILVITFVAVLAQIYLFSPMRVIGDSMNPAFDNHDIIIVSKIAYEKGEPERFDVAVFDYRYDTDTKYIKRIIGLPGETVEIKNNSIYINSEELKEYYGVYDEDKHLEDYPAYTLKSDEYFVLGDNRDHSVDSRSGDVGAVNKSMLVGRAVFRIWPFDAIGSLKYQ
ncbi:MAG: signal peptidase I [Lachnospiraceae bacterium]|nr:signal peptidase I [Lachnospiraceae bacterium]